MSLLEKLLIALTLILCCAIFAVKSFADSNDTFLALDAANTNKLPKHFRATIPPYLNNVTVSTIGLADLHIAGSGEFSEQQLLNAIKLLPRPLTIVDLRQESHGFINGNAVSWYGPHNWANRGKSDQQAAEDQMQLLADLSKQTTVVVTKNTKIKHNAGSNTSQPITLTVANVKSEADLAQQNQLGYQRFYVTDRMRPTDAVVDQFITYVNQLPAGTWLYFHCRAGDGRTTTFMVLYDMMHNAKQVSMNDIVQRQALLGGINLLSAPNPNKFGYPDKERRIAFIKNFYNYSRSNQDDFHTSWQSWVQSHAGA